MNTAANRFTEVCVLSPKIRSVLDNGFPYNFHSRKSAGELQAIYRRADYQHHAKTRGESPVYCSCIIPSSFLEGKHNKAQVPPNNPFNRRI